MGGQVSQGEQQVGVGPFRTERAARSADEIRFIGYSRFLYVSALLGHIAFLFIFYALGQTVLWQYNLVSIAVFAYGTFFHERGHMRLALALGMTEVVVHAILATIYTGFETGFYLFIFQDMAVVFLTPFFTTRGRVIVSAALLACLLGLFAVTKTTGVVQPVEPAVAEFFLVCNWIYFALLTWVGLNGLRDAIQVTEAALQTEIAKSEFLLQNILPETIIEHLKDEPETIAHDYSDVTIMFADIVGFTAYASGRDPGVVVGRLNAVFSRLDALTEAHGLEKIKTIGDSYMVVGGLPAPRPDHAHAIAELALEILQAMRELDGTDNTIRIGINTGPVVAGVIGKKKFAYDLWGDAVNIAARMESYGEPGRVVVSETTKAALGDAYVFESRGPMHVKGKGTMETFFLDPL